MSGKRPGHGPLWFCMKFLVLVVALTALWWTILPYYGQLLLQVSGVLLIKLFNIPIESGRIDVAKGVLNTGTNLVFIVSGHERSAHIAQLVTNLPPYLALVLATSGIALWRRIRILLYGCGILCLTHVAFIVVALRYGDWMRSNEFPVAFVQFLLILPFLLWVAFTWEFLLALAGIGRSDGVKQTAVQNEKELFSGNTTEEENKT